MAQLTVTETTFVDNKADTGGAVAIYVDGTREPVDVTFHAWRAHPALTLLPLVTAARLRMVCLLRSATRLQKAV